MASKVRDEWAFHVGEVLIHNAKHGEGYVCLRYSLVDTNIHFVEYVTKIHGTVVRDILYDRAPQIFSGGVVGEVVEGLF